MAGPGIVRTVQCMRVLESVWHASGPSFLWNKYGAHNRRSSYLVIACSTFSTSSVIVISRFSGLEMRVIEQVSFLLALVATVAISSAENVGDNRPRRLFAGFDAFTSAVGQV